MIGVLSLEEHFSFSYPGAQRVERHMCADATSPSSQTAIASERLGDQRAQHLFEANWKAPATSALPWSTPSINSASLNPGRGAAEPELDSTARSQGVSFAGRAMPR
jgi:hypothetical protein